MYKQVPEVLPCRGSGGLLLYVHVFFPEVSRGPLLQCLFTISCFKELIEAPTPCRSDTYVT